MDEKNIDTRKLAYIYGEMGKEEEAKYKEELASNPEERDEIELQRIIIGQAKRDVLAEKAHAKPRRRDFFLSKKFLHYYLLPIAAVILLFIIIGNFMSFSNNPEIAFQRFYKDYTPENYPESSIYEAQFILTGSLDAYSKGNYETVTENMRTLMENGELNVRGQIVLGIYDAWNDPVFKRLDPGKTTQEKALWYLAVSSMKLDDLKKAQMLLKELSANFEASAGKATRMERRISRKIMTE